MNVQIIFERCEDDSQVSIHELCRSLSRKPILLSVNKAMLLSRYLIEPKDSPKIQLDELREEFIRTITQRLILLLEGLYDKNSVAMIRENIRIKLNLEELFKLKKNTDYIDIAALEKANLGLNKQELSYLIYVMYKQSKDLEKLSYSFLMEYLNTLKSAPNERKPMRPEAKMNLQEFNMNIPRRFSDPQEQPRPAFEMTNYPFPPSNVNEEGTMNEEQLIEITKNCFHEIAEYMKQKNITTLGLYKDVITKKKIDNMEIDVIAPLDFLNGLRKLGIDDLQSLDYTCLIKVLSMKDPEKHIQVSDIVQILEDYGITEISSEEQELIGELHFEDLDKISVVVMLGLAEYLKKSNMTPENMFGGITYRQGIEVDGKRFQVELINSTDFFAALKEIGIYAEEEAHGNLKAFLALDPNYPDKIMAKKLKKRIEEFTNDDDLRAFAQNCYQELLNEEKLHETPGRGDPNKTPGGKTTSELT